MQQLERDHGVLEQIVGDVRRLREAGRTPVVVFDLDHTLFDNAPRTWAILASFFDAHGVPHLRERLELVPKLGLPYMLSEILEGRMAIEDEAVRGSAGQYWRDRFFQDDWIAHDVAYPGAAAYVHHLFAAGATIVYLTGRDSPNMLVGTTLSLRRTGFPVGLPRTLLVLKPAFEIPDAEFKRDAVQFVATLGQTVGFFDNEPANCTIFAEAFAECRSVFLDTVRAPGPLELHKSVQTIAGFASYALSAGEGGA